MFQQTTSLKKIQALKKRIRAVQGGTSASKTISILLLLINAAQSDTKPTLTSIVSESFPHLKRGVIRDFLAIMTEHHYFKDDRWNKSDFIYTFETGSRIEFFSADQPSKVRGPRRDRLFINEANNIAYEAFDQLEVRTKELIYLDWNPTIEFWYYDKVANRSDTDFSIVTYKDNEGLDPAIVASIEQRKGNASWWRVYGEGQLGEVEGRIYKGWQIIEAVPFEARLICYVVDFGWSPDPATIQAMYYYNGGFIFDQIAYQKELSNEQMAKILKNLPTAPVVADSAEPKSIAELNSYGLTVIPAIKGPDSINFGIGRVQSQKVSLTKQSVDAIREYRGYINYTDKNGKIFPEPDPLCDDHALDPIRYGITYYTHDEDDQQEKADRLLARFRNTPSQVK